MRHGRAIGGLAVASALLAPGAARADIIAAVQVTGPDGSPDIAVMNATTGERATLPAGINTAAQELHPSISNDGRRLVFLRLDPAAGTRRVIVLDTATGQTADLFNGFEVAARPPSDPEIARDGSVVYTGAPFAPVSGGGFRAEVVFTQLANFPNGPVRPRRDRAAVQLRRPGSHLASRAPAGSSSPTARSDRASARRSSSARWAATRRTRSSARDHAYSHPAIAATSPQLALLVDRPLARRAGRHRVPPRDDRRACPAPRRCCRRSSTRATSRCRVHARQPLRRLRAPLQDARPPVRVGQPDADAAERRTGSTSAGWRSVTSATSRSTSARRSRSRTSARASSPRTSRWRAASGCSCSGSRAASGSSASAPSSCARSAACRSAAFKKGKRAQALELPASTASACGRAATS